MKPLLVVIASQLLFTAGDLLARLKMRQLGFGTEAFVSWWFAGYMLIRTAATFGQLWVLAKLVLGQALPMFAASSIVLSVLLSVTVLNEGLTTKTVVGGPARRRRPRGIDATVVTTADGGAAARPTC